MSNRFATACRITALALSLAACGGGGGSSGDTGMAQSASVSSGAITAFGSVFVNGHEFETTHAKVIDDDTDATTTTAALEVGMVVSVKPTSTSRNDAPEAAEIHVSPLARGYVDASGASTITVMGQTVQLTSSTVFTDHRACLTAATPCAAISAQSGLAVTAGATPGTFVAVHGYLFAAGGGAGAQIVASLVSIVDRTPVAGATLPFKAEGAVSAVNAATPALTIGAETIDLSKATCRAAGATVACASAFKVGDIVSARGTTAPVGTAFTADAARAARLLPQTAGASVEVEGKVSSVSGSSFVVRGITVDGSALPAAQWPAVGDKIEVTGTIAADGLSVKATSIEHDEHAALPRVLLAGPLTSVAAGATAGTFDVVVLGQTVSVTADSHIADRTSSLPVTFNINNFQTYLQGKTPYVVLRTTVTSTGSLRASGFDIVPAPASGFVGVAGSVDAAPTVPVAGKSTLTVHGVSVLFDPTKVSVAKGALVAAKGAATAAGIDTTVTDGRLVVLPPDEGDDHGFDD